MKETTKIEYRIQDEHHGWWLTNKPSSQDFANYNGMRSRAAVISGLMILISIGRNIISK